MYPNILILYNQKTQCVEYTLSHAHFFYYNFLKNFFLVQDIQMLCGFAHSNSV